ncbi:15142_t:CDS:2, partial [Racocetra persica]
SNLKLDRSMVSKILKNKSKWLMVTKDQLSSTIFRHKQVKYPLLDQSMRIWVEQVTNSEMFLTELMIKEQAADFAKALNLEANSALLSSLSEYREKLPPDQTLASRSRPGFKK